jgi:uncharacterized damage-inducible protein DinB
MSRALVELLHGKHAHTDTLVCVDVTADVAGRRPEGSPHSVWQIVWHLNYWMEHELLRIAGTPRPYPEHASLSWPSALPGAEAWGLEQARFKELLGRLSALAGSSPADLAREITATDRAEAAHASSLEAVLWQTLVHNSYHLGQVVLVRQALRAWPPAAGSDTW